MLDLDTGREAGKYPCGVPSSTFTFFKNLVDVVFFEGQAAVNKILWPAILEASQMDEEFKEDFLETLAEHAWSPEIQKSVFTTPVLDEDCVKAVLETGMLHDWFIAKDLLPLVKHDGFNAELFYYAVGVLACVSPREAVKFIGLVAEQEKLTVEWLVEAYCRFDNEVFKREIIPQFANNSPSKGVPDVVLTHYASVEDVMLERIYPHYPELPEAWVKHMMKSMRKEKTDA